MAEAQRQASKSQTGDEKKAGQKRRTGGDGNGLENFAFGPAKAMQLGGANVSHWITTNQELASFWATRLKKNMSMLEGLSRCKTGQDYANVMARAASELVHDYADEFDRVLSINLEPAE